MPNSLAPLLSDRLRRLLRTRGLPRALLVRRALAICLVLFAGLLAFRPHGDAAEQTRRIVVAAADLRSGMELGHGDLRLRELPSDAVPSGAQVSTAALAGRVLVSAARAGEPITDSRLVGEANTRLTATAPGAVSVGVRLADPGVAELLRPGALVDVVGGAGGGSMADPAGWPAGAQATDLLAGEATVITVRKVAADDGQPAPIVVLALPREAATRVAALSLRQPVTVTLRPT